MKNVFSKLSLLMLAILISFPAPTLAGGEHTTMGNLPRDIYKIRIHHGLDWYYRYSFSKKAIGDLYDLNGQNLWYGYGAGGWPVPDDSKYESYIELYSSSRPQPYYLFIVASKSKPSFRWLFLFNSLKYNCDNQGQHCGNHDWVYDGRLAVTFVIDAKRITDIYRLANVPAGWWS